ncbi:MAG: F0F1 ATP synthase subunit B [Oscillospiraceae bacterium]|nr:F0F1 ATP synthase subunit B [Oscillospiraceae bacterium]
MEYFNALLLSSVPEGRMIALDMQTVGNILIQLFNAVLLCAILTFLLYKPVLKFVQGRRARIEGQLTQAADDVAKAQELKAQYEKQLADIQVERGEILEAAHKLALEKTNEMLSEAKREVSAIREKASADIQNEREQINAALRLHIIEVGSLMAGKFVTHSIDDATQSRLFAETLAELEETAWPE